MASWNLCLRSSFFVPCLLWNLVFCMEAAHLWLNPNVTDITKRLGDSLSIQCKIFDNPKSSRHREEGSPVNAVVTKRPGWSFRGDSGGHARTVTTDGHYSIRQSNEFTTGLIVNSVNFQNQGTYQCSAGVEDKILLRSFTLKIYDDVRVLDAPLVQHPVQGTDARIKCLLNGRPKPQISWFKLSLNKNTGRVTEWLLSDNIDRFSFEQDDQVMIIRNFNADGDNSLYKCQASQDISASILEINITVIGYVPPHIRNHARKLEVLENEDVSLPCEATGYPAPAYEWLKDGAKVNINGRRIEWKNGVLKLRRVILDDSGQYTCNASNVAGFQVSSIEFGVIAQPEIQAFSNDRLYALVGRPFNVSCKFVPRAISFETFWIRNNTKFPTSDNAASLAKLKQQNIYGFINNNESTLFFQKISPSHAGTYKCMVSNKAGMREQNILLIVEEPPLIVDSSEKLVRTVVRTVTLFCHAKGVPQVTWNWTSAKGEFLILNQKVVSNSCKFGVSSDGSSSTLEVSPKIAQDYGKYACIATNKLGKDQKYFELQKTEIPPIPHVIPIGTHPNKLHFKLINQNLINFANEPNELLVMYNDEGFEQTTTFNYSSSNATIWIKDLRPNGAYKFSAKYANEAGQSNWSTFQYKTSEASVPTSPQIVTANMTRCLMSSCVIFWSSADDMGSPISRYTVTYREIPPNDDAIRSEYREMPPNADAIRGRPIGNELRVKDVLKNAFDSSSAEHSALNEVTLMDLQPQKFYAVRITAQNAVGSSVQSEEIWISTSFGNELDPKEAGVHSRGSVLLLAFLAVISVILAVGLVDLLCYCVGSCGLLALIFGRRPSPSLKRKATNGKADVDMSSDGKSSIVNGEQVSIDAESKETSENTPMIESHQIGTAV